MILEEIAKRHSVRIYSKKKVEDWKLREIIEAGRLAPSAYNYQPWKFIVVKDEEKRGKMAETRWGKHIAKAPVLMVACKVRDGFLMGGWFDSAILDIGIAVEHMALQAVHLGLGTCWVGDFREDVVKETLEIPQDVRVVALLTIGYPAEDKDYKPRGRKPFSEIVSFEKF